MTSFRFVPIGRAAQTADGPVLAIDPAFRDGLVGLEDFRWIVVHWLADRAGQLDEGALVLPSPYRQGPEKLGVFATRSPRRPNPICTSVASLIAVDRPAGILRLGWIDCDEGTPILDIKPYQASVDRVERPEPPAWCAGWPKSVETAGSFDWSSVFPD